MAAHGREIHTSSSIGTNDNEYHGPSEKQYTCSLASSSCGFTGQPAASCTFGRFQN
ncbi:hypothetical protein NEUTE1DRAFT_34726 [Neurospora tetrasperma FGSC 2508]|uniref:Uncharacterized protein n=1 Tax=Neurospora tetrasperma (strain FGSC 2508 / ATCC MYA-4615 / P0657) TaxID=510951 RepID=F8MCX7_NEUT8|nr:uncharacterized protein NEUTE1DRAFT_34726 [Neurospora tetrasperma FGSC 2508]EGO60521.1 hypothetical protein NEUTE1DRAFT_34726 [Neurospora tetrasperma FGSC 2508]EGZ75503.1 hypothetical protein NEUTE2DRAFT_59223 [Neurospora tetrasperma FGSC 2509]